MLGSAGMRTYGTTGQALSAQGHAGRAGFGGTVERARQMIVVLYGRKGTLAIHCHPLTPPSLVPGSSISTLNVRRWPVPPVKRMPLWTTAGSVLIMRGFTFPGIPTATQDATRCLAILASRGRPSGELIQERSRSRLLCLTTRPNCEKLNLQDSGSSNYGRALGGACSGSLGARAICLGEMGRRPCSSRASLRTHFGNPVRRLWTADAKAMGESGNACPNATLGHLVQWRFDACFKNKRSSSGLRVCRWLRHRFIYPFGLLYMDPSKRS